MDTPTTTTWASSGLVLKMAVFISVENPVFLVDSGFGVGKIFSSVDFIVLYDSSMVIFFLQSKCLDITFHKSI